MSTTNLSKLKLTLLIAIALIVGAILGVSYKSLGIKNLNVFKRDKVQDILEILESRYVDTINTDTMENLAINQILSKLDPHSVYLNPDEAKELNQTLEGNFEGIGIEYYHLNDTLLITKVNESGPAKEAGLLVGDKVVKINGIACSKLGNKKSIHLLRGEKGTNIQLSVQRATNLIEFNVIRDQIFVSSIDVAIMADNETAYIKISNFGANTLEDFVQSIQQLKNKGANKLILDLRGNGGGYLDAATSLIDQFLGGGKLIVYTQGLHEPRTNYNATDGGIFENGKIVVLINEQTASASEIVAGALQDWKRGVIIGRKSFGKGLVQQQFPFYDGSVINLTVARYFTPSGKSIQKPYKNGKYFSNLHQLDSSKNKLIHNPSKSKSKLANQPLHSIATSSSDEGGIKPDILIEVDTSIFNNDFYKFCVKNSLIQHFAYSKLLPALSKQLLITEDDFVNNYKISDELYQNFLATIPKNKINDLSDIEKCRPQISKELKTIIAYYIYGDAAMYKFLNTQDEFVQKALLTINAGD